MIMSSSEERKFDSKFIVICDNSQLENIVSAYYENFRKEYYKGINKRNCIEIESNVLEQETKYHQVKK